MQRPVMNPSFVFDGPAPTKPRRKPFGWVWRGIGWLWRLMLAHPFGRRGVFRNEEGTKFSRFVRGLTYRMAFVPLLLVIFLIAIVLAATHPGRSQHGPDPLAYGVYYDPVNFLADDGAHLEGWLVPVIDAKRVIEEKDRGIDKQYPAVVLVHDFAATRQQLLPLVQPLHNSGFVVLAVNLRGAASLSGEAQTFGIRESRDVKAAVEMLRRRAFVDKNHVGVIGIGTGANACLIAARNDPSIGAIVLSDPVDGFDEAFASRVGTHAWLPPLRSLFKWTFQVMYGVDTAELDMHNFSQTIADRHVLLTDGRQQLMDPAAIRGLQRYLHKRLDDQVASAK